MNIDRETADKYQGLFNYLNDQYGINPTIEGMNDLIAEVDKTKQLLIHSVSKSFFCDAKLVNGISNCKKQCDGCLRCLHTPKK